MAPTQQDYEACRTINHPWEEYEPTFSRLRPTWKFHITLICTRCGTQRHDGIDAYGNVRQRYYEYPEGYKLPAEQVPTKAEFRLRHVKRKRLRSVS